MSEYAGELIMREKKGILIVVSGFSGAGKGTLMKKLMQDYDNYALSISATTRQPRVGEEDGREYFFKTKDEFEKMIARDELIEYARYVNNYYGKQYKYEIGVKKINLKAPTVSVSAGKSSAKVSWSKVNNYRYEVQYATNSKFQGAKKVSVHDQKTSVTIKYLTSKKKYYVRVRSCAKTENDNNKKAYSAWSKVKTVTVK